MIKNISFVLFSLLSVILLLLLITLTQCTDGPTIPGENENVRTLSKTEEGIVSSSAVFGFNLIKKISQTQKDENIVVSPLSVSTSFGMVLNGADGETYDQIKSVLGLNPFVQDDINKSYQSLENMLKGIDNKVEFSSANSVWYANGFNVESDFLDMTKKYFNAEVTEADFSDPATLDMINDWVKRSTNDKIEKIIERINRDVVMYVINAIYFKGTWKYQFDKNATRDDFFHVTPNQSVPCKMMAQKQKFYYFSGTDYQAIKLPYGNQSYNMMILLPSNLTAVDNLLDGLSAHEFNIIKNSLEEKELTVLLPKFKVEYERKLNDGLINMGMINAFMPGKADFTLVHKAGGIWISEVKHKTFIDVNEEGTEAAAVTSIEFVRSLNGGYLKIDRPFVFIIYEENTNTILFIGKIVNPS